MELQPQRIPAFDDFKNLVQYNLGLLTVKRTPEHDQFIDDFERLITQAAGRAREKLEQITLLQSNVSDASAYAFHRRDLINVAEGLLRYATPRQLVATDDAAPVSALIAHQLHRAIDELFEFIELRFAPPEPIDTSLGDGYRRIAQAKIAYRFKELVDDLETDGTDPTLLTIFQGPYDQARADANGNFLTYRKTRYLLALKEALLPLLQRKHRDITSTVMDILINFDFNTPAFFHYCLKDLDLALDLCKTNADQMHCLHDYHRRLQSATTTPGVRLIEKQEPLLSRLRSTIHEEKTCLQTTNGGNRAARNRPVREPLPEENSKFGITTELVAYLLDVADRAKLADVNRSLLSRLLSGVFRSRDGQPISDKYLRKATHSFEDRVKEEGIGVLQIMMDLIKGDFNRDR